MDITRATQPNSQQVNADDLDEPVVVTVTGAEEGTDEQPLFLSLAEFPGRTYRPSRGMARVIRAAWGGETDDWTGTRRLELFRNPTIKFGPATLGGIQISKISHIDGPLKVNLTVTRGKRAFFTVQPLAAPVQDPVRDWPSEIDATTTTAALTALYQQIRQIPGAYTDELKTAFTDRGAALKVTAAPEQTEGDAA